MELVDLRSDTVPGPHQRCVRERPRLKSVMMKFAIIHLSMRLEDLAAGMVGKEASLFVPLGTMGNLIALLVHWKHREEKLWAASLTSI